MRNELILRRRQDHRHAGADRQPAPTRKSRGTRAGKSIPERRGFGRHDRGDEARTRQRSDRSAVDCCRAIERGRRGAGGRNALESDGPSDADAHRLSAGIIDCDFGAQDEHRQAPANGLEQQSRQQQLEAPGIDAADEEDGQNAALGRAPRRQLQRSWRKRLDVAGDLALEEARRIGSGDANRRQGTQVADDRCIARRCQFSGWVSESGDRCPLERGAARVQEIGPGGHGDGDIEDASGRGKPMLKSNVSLVWQRSRVK